MRALSASTYFFIFVQPYSTEQLVESSSIATSRTSRFTGKTGRQTFIIDYFLLNENKKENVSRKTTFTLTFLV